MKKCSVFLCAIIFVFGLIGHAYAVNITVLNNSFETGDFSDWITSPWAGGSLAVVTVSTSNPFGGGIEYSATEGIYFAQLTANASVYQYVEWNAGDVLAFDWAFQAWDYLPYNDYGYFKVAGTDYLLADVSAVGGHGETIWNTYTHFFTSAGSGSIEFGVMNRYDNVFDSKLLIDNVGASAHTPEPTTMLLFGSGLIGLAGFRRRLKKS